MIIIFFFFSVRCKNIYVRRGGNTLYTYIYICICIYTIRLRLLILRSALLNAPRRNRADVYRSAIFVVFAPNVFMRVCVCVLRTCACRRYLYQMNKGGNKKIIYSFFFSTNPLENVCTSYTQRYYDIFFIPKRDVYESIICSNRLLGARGRALKSHPETLTHENYAAARRAEWIIFWRTASALDTSLPASLISGIIISVPAVTYCY